MEREAYLPHWVLAATLALSAVGGLSLHRQVRAREAARFAVLAAEAIGAVETRLSHYIDALRAGAGLFAAESDVDAREFKAFASALQLQERYPGIQGFGYSRKLSDRPARHAIVYLQPQDPRNKAALGFDMFSEPVRRRAMERARDTGAPAASGRVRLVQEIDEDVQPGFLIYMPVYRGGAAPNDIAQRRNALAGFVYSPFRTRDLFKGVLTRTELGITIRDQDDAPAGPALYSVPTGRFAHRLRRRVPIAGREWEIEISAATLLTPFERGQGWALMALGLCAGITFFGLLRASARRGQKLKRAQADLEASARTLERTVERRTAELSAANQELEAFSYSVSHDLRAPLRSILSFAELLQRNLASRASPRELNDFERIRAAAKRMHGLIDSLLELSRVANRPIDRRRVDLTALCGELASSLAKRYPHPVDFKVAPGLAVEGDEVLIGVLMDNLLSNAWKYTGKTAGARVEVGLADGELFVRDNGVGIPGEGSAEIFAPFKRLHRSEDFEGSGIGLATARRIVQRHGGTIRAESEEGRGTTIYFNLGAGE